MTKHKMPANEWGKAQWIWNRNNNIDNVNLLAQLRKVFELPSKPQAAIVKISADYAYRLYVNGRFVVRGPARGYQESWPYDELDLAPFLQKGKNVLTAEVNSLGISSFRYIHQGYSGLLLAGEASGIRLDTDSTWKIRSIPGQKRRTARSSMNQSFQEHLDMRGFDEDWAELDYDDSLWKNASVSAKVFGMPWSGMEERGIPHLKVERILPAKLISCAEGECLASYRDAENVTSVYASEKKEFVASSDELRKDGDFARLQIPAAGLERFRAIVVDFGREVLGSPVLRVEGAEGREILDFLVTETLSDLTPDILHIDNSGCGTSFGNRLFLKPGTNERTFFEPWGFRYAVIVMRNSTVPLKIGLGLDTYLYPLEPRSKFECSDELLVRIREICVHTQQCCMDDAYIDCPWREQAQWWGDARVQAANTFYISGDSRLLARGIRNIGGMRSSDGLTYGHAPTVAHSCILPDFTLTWVLTFHDLWWQTGDASLFGKLAGRVEEALAYFNERLDDHGLVPYDCRYWLFLDWCDLHKEGVSTLLNLQYLSALRAASFLSTKNKDEKHARIYGKRATQLEKNILKHLCDKKTGRLVDGLTWEGKQVQQCSPHVAAWSILLDLCPKSHKELEHELLAFLEHPMPRGGTADYNPVTPSPFFIYYIYEALKKQGRGAEVLDNIRRWWAWLPENDYSTCFENWPNIDLAKDKGLTSYCHAWSAHPLVHMANITLGITQIAPAWSKVRFAPQWKNLSWAKGTVPTPHGEIEVSWEKKDGVSELNLSLPPNIEAELLLPGIPNSIVQGGKHKFRCPSAN